MSDKEKRKRTSDEHRRSLEQLRKESGLNDTEEYAADMPAPYGSPVQAPVNVRETSNRGMENSGEETNERSRWIGYTALAVAILSLFILPFLFGATAVFLGFIAIVQGNKTVGVWSVILGIVSVAGYFLLAPLYS